MAKSSRLLGENLADDVEQLVRVERLDDPAGRTGLPRPRLLVGTAFRGQDQHRCRLVARILPDMLDEGEAVHVGHLAVHEDEVVGVGFGERDGGESVVGDINLVAQYLEQEAGERNQQLLAQHERARLQAMAEVDQIRQEGLRLQRESQAEAERLHNDALQFRQQTQQQCDAFVARSRQEAAATSEGANSYAEQVLGELEGRLQELSQVVLGGRHELVRLQNPEAASQGRPSDPRQGAKPTRRSRLANGLRNLAG